MHFNVAEIFKSNENDLADTDNSVRRSMMFVFFAIQILFIPGVAIAQNSAPKSLFINMINAMDKVQTARYQLILNERIKDVYKSNKYLTKVQVHPFKVYTFSLTSNIGAEVLYIEGANNNEAVVNPNRFPWFNLNLSPHSMLVRKGHLFRFDQSGFAYMSKMFSHYYSSDSVFFVTNLKLMTDTIFDGQLCYRLVLYYPEYKWRTYTVKKGETFTTIADKFFLNDYMVMDRNGKTSFSDVSEGEKIIIPVAFAKKIILSIDKSSFLPVQQILYDDKGLLAVLEFKNLIVNQPIPAEEFTCEYKKYGF
ncbi:MAG: DUF1571 domain-containing protein [Bacteroidia bacterium]